jgi:hypothetical protein
VGRNSTRIRTGTLVAALSLACATAARAAPIPITDCVDDTGLQQAVATGGSYVFACNGTISLKSTLTVAGTVSLNAGGNAVTIAGTNQYGVQTVQLFDVTSGANLSLNGLKLAGGGAIGSAGAVGATGGQGALGTMGTPGASQSNPNGQPGTPGDPGNPGDPGDPGDQAEGGAIFEAAGATVTLNGDTLINNVALGGKGGAGGPGGNGGGGGSGGDSWTGTDGNGNSICAGDGGNGANGGIGGAGGAGGDGGPGEGGAVYVSANATLTVQNTTFTNNLAQGGAGGTGGNGGLGGSGAAGGGGCATLVSIPPDGEPGNGATGGTGGPGGATAVGEGGAIYNAGMLSLSEAAFSGNSVLNAGGNAGTGGTGGYIVCGANEVGGNPPPVYVCDKAEPGNGGDGGDGGAGADAEGGAVYSTSIPSGCATFGSPNPDTARTQIGGGGQGGDPGQVNGEGISEDATQGGTGSNGSVGTATGPELYVPGHMLSGGCNDTLSGTVTYTEPAGVPAANVEVQIDGPGGDQTVVTNAQGQYSQALPVGSYVVDPESDLDPKADASTDCTVSGTSCDVNLNQNRTANFSVQCEPTHDFHTSMVAVGCFVPYNAAHTQWKAIGKFRMDGIDFQSPNDQNDPVLFDDTTDNVSAAQDVVMSLAAPGWTGKWLAMMVPLNISFPTDETTYQFQAPSFVTPTGGLSLVNGLLSTGTSVTLFGSPFGFPSHAPAIALTFSVGPGEVGQAELKLQLSWPTEPAFIDPINGLWKKFTPSGSVNVSYPNIIRFDVTANNNVGVATISGNFGQSDVWDIGTGGNLKRGEKPPVGSFELAGVGFAWNLATGVIDTNGTVAWHEKPNVAWTARFGNPANFVFGVRVIHLAADWKYYEFHPNGTTVIIPVPVHFDVSANGINKLIPWLAEAQIYWQRFDFNVGLDLSKITDPNPPFQIGGGFGFSWLPRFKNDHLWFQEVASIDGDGSVDLTSPFDVSGDASMKVANVPVIKGKLRWDGNGFSLTGQASFDLNKVLRVPLLGTFLGTHKIEVLPLSGSASLTAGAGKRWEVTLHGQANGVFGQVHPFAADLRWTPDLLSLCLTGPSFGSHHLFRIGIWYDGRTHIGGCDTGRFGQPSNDPEADVSAVSAGAGTRRFRVGRNSRLSAVAIKGVSGAPSVALSGPDGMRFSVSETDPTDITHDGAMIMDPSDNTTYIVFATPPAGSYSVASLPGSPAIGPLEFAPRLATPSRAASAVSRPTRSATPTASFSAAKRARARARPRAASSGTRRSRSSRPGHG